MLFHHRMTDNQTQTNRRRPFALALAALALALPGSHAQAALIQPATESHLTTMYSFTGADGNLPMTALVQATDGNFYGTTAAGGAKGAGTIFQLTPTGTLTTLHSFSGSTDGGFPEAALIQATDGSLYGTTAGGGAGDGTLFKITPAVNATFTTLYKFSATNSKGFNTDGAFPESALVQGPDGLFYGTTSSGGAKGNGTVFKFDAVAGKFTTVQSFAGIANDAGPSNPLALSKAGIFYGTTIFNGTMDFGSLFTVSPTGSCASLFSFNANKGGAYEPGAGVIQAADGSFYGTTLYGGLHSAGTIFKWTAKSMTVVYSFPGTNSQRLNDTGAAPHAALLQGADGFFYGTTTTGGVYGHGTIFKLDAATAPGTVTPLYSFTGKADGGEPSGSLIQGADGALYGTTKHSSTDGTVFRYAL